MNRYDWIKVSLSEFQNKVLNKEEGVMKFYCIVPNGDGYYFYDNTDMEEKSYYNSFYRKFYYRKDNESVLIPLDQQQVEEFMVMLKTLLRKDKIERLKERIVI